MRHLKAGKRLGRGSEHRRAMMRNLVTSLFVHERVTTSDTKAKELRRVAERLITRAARLSTLVGRNPKRMSPKDRARLLAARRYIARHVRAHGTDRDDHLVNVVRKLFEELGPRFAKREGGYTRIVKLPHFRKGDNAPLSMIEILPGEAPAEGRKKGTGGKGKAAAPKGERKGVLGGLLGGRKKAKPAQEAPSAEEPEDEADEEEDKE